MATFKQRHPDGRVQSEPDVTIELDAIVDGPRPGRGDPAADAVWRELRRRFLDAEYQHPRFDPRRLPQDKSQRALWRSNRRQWLAELFRDDPRVIS
jgi:hypothetical protein